jgi:hypothetical protein
VDLLVPTIPLPYANSHYQGNGIGERGSRISKGQ